MALRGNLDLACTSTTTSSSTVVVGSVMSIADSPAHEITIFFSSVHLRAASLVVGVAMCADVEDGSASVNGFSKKKTRKATDF